MNNCFVLERNGRSTGMGAYTDTHLFSIKQIVSDFCFE